MAENIFPVIFELMGEFAESSGIMKADESATRYLWTDAFAVCNFLELFRRTREDQYLNLATTLARQVHWVLGRHRSDDSRHGWISGLAEDVGSHHPTKGGLRIGKRFKERKPQETFDEHLEWERDGQYYHYLTKWMHALCCMYYETKDSSYLQWALELANAKKQSRLERSLSYQYSDVGNSTCT